METRRFSSSFKRLALSGSRFRDTAYSHINIGNTVPGRKIHDSIGRQIENPLECAHRICRSRTENPVGCDGGNCWIIPGNAVKLLLHLSDLFSAGANGQVVAGPGGGHPCYALSRVDIHIAAIIVSDNINGGIPFFSQILGAPLAQAVAGHTSAVTVGCKDWLPYSRAG